MKTGASLSIEQRGVLHNYLLGELESLAKHGVYPETRAGAERILKKHAEIVRKIEEGSKE